MSVKERVANNKGEVEAIITKGIISGLSALNDIEGQMVHDEIGTIITRPASGVKTTTASQKKAATRQAQKVVGKQGAAKTKVGKTTGKEHKPALRKEIKNDQEYNSFTAIEVLAKSDAEVVEISFNVGREHLQKLRYLLEMSGITTSEQVFNPGFGPHRQTVVSRIVLRDYSEFLAEGINLLYEAQFVLGKQNGIVENKLTAEQIITKLLA